MGIEDWSITPGSNSTVSTGGPNVAEGNNPSDVNDGMRRMMSDLRRFANDTGAKASSTGTDTVALTTEGLLAAYADGTALGFIAGGTNAGAATLNVDSVGAKAIVKGAGTALAAGDIVAGAAHLVVYDASQGSGSWMLINPAGVLSNVSEDTSPTFGGHAAGGGYDITGLGTLSMTEQAAANADVGGDGQLWVKTATPNEIWFTDDGGTDFQLSKVAASQAEAEAGTESELRDLSPLRIAQAIAALTTGVGIAPVVQVFTASGIYTPTAGMVACLATVVGGGGGGGTSSGNDAGSGGGGGGGTAIEMITAATIGASQTVTVPAAAAAAANGGTVSLGSLCSATGGTAGESQAANDPSASDGGAGGVGSGGDLNIAGQGGAFGLSPVSSMHGGGNGGASYFGAGGAGAGADTIGAAGGNYGGGGAGGVASTSTDRAGGAGGVGVVYIVEYF